MRGQFDVLIIGAGPAGSVTALCLARSGWRVALIGPPDPPAHRCGETLPPEISPILRRLGLWDVFLDSNPLESPGTLSVWGSPEAVPADFIHNPFGPGWHIDRARFDSALVRAAQDAGATLLRRRPAGLSVLSGLSAPYKVDASGIGLPFEGTLRRRTGDLLIAYVFRTLSASDSHDLRTYIESVPAGWWYSSPLPDGKTIAMLFSDPSLHRSRCLDWRAQLRLSSLTARRLSAKSIPSLSVIGVLSSIRERLTGEDWLAVGDSASAYDPLSGRGIFKALRHAELAAEALGACAAGDRAALTRYAARVRADYDRYVRERALFYRAEQRWAEDAFWRARHVANEA